MTEQNEPLSPQANVLTPEALSTQAENELICEKLLGWERFPDPKRPAFQWRKMFTPTSWEVLGTPTFTTWADAGLILEAWTAAGNDYDIDGTSHDDGARISARLRQVKGISYIGDFGGCAQTAPMAVRAAALKYIRSLP